MYKNETCLSILQDVFQTETILLYHMNQFLKDLTVLNLCKQRSAHSLEKMASYTIGEKIRGK